jgi:hypothetical protein
MFHGVKGNEIAQNHAKEGEMKKISLLGKTRPAFLYPSKPPAGIVTGYSYRLRVRLLFGL